MKIAAQMDEISSIDITTDSTFAILLAAQNRGHEIFFYLPSDLTLYGNVLFAVVKKVKLQRKIGDYYEVISEERIDLTRLDVILVRQDPPFNISYITSTYLLEKIKDQVLILNNPSEIRNCPEKIFVTEFLDFTPKTIITSSLKELEDFHRNQKNIILKPLYSCGGDGIFFLEKNSKNLATIVELLLKHYQAPVIAQRFIPEVKNGDKRILLLDGEILGVVNRVAKEGEVRSNFHVGATAQMAELTKRDLEICQVIGPKLKEKGLFFVGIDVIGDFVTEINVTSPTCIMEINELFGVNLEEKIVVKIEEKLKENL